MGRIEGEGFIRRVRPLALTVEVQSDAGKTFQMSLIGEHSVDDTMIGQKVRFAGSFEMDRLVCYDSRIGGTHRVLGCKLGELEFV